MKFSFKNIGYPLAWIIAFLGISYFIGQVTQANMAWYADLPKSPLNPPRIAFPIAWTSLYIMLAVAGSLIFRAKGEGISKHKKLFAVYMLMNWAWSFIFFGAHMVTLGFVWIVLSALVLGVLILCLWRGSKKIAALLCIPTLCWSLFAAYLNGYIALMM
ncbi:MAG: tryptophan-rich sensory protein [Micavibrio sp.]|nr:tryptophan-rich sensory protein [Micavibrio sp.]HCK32187.1 tryptophan-rich sensory protein [Rhodospirillaceae bacterium]